MTINEWVGGVDPSRIDLCLGFDGPLEGFPRVVQIRANLREPVPGGFNNWSWMFVLNRDGNIQDGPFVWGQDWWDYCEKE